MTRSHDRRHLPRRCFVACSMLLASCLLTAGAAQGRGRPEGEELVVVGSVSDPSGMPIGGVTVEIRASRSAFSLRDFRVARRGSRRASATTDARGSFEIPWSWHPYYNRFDLVAGVNTGVPGSEGDFEILASIDLSRRIRSGNPVVVTVEIEDRSGVDALNEFLETLDSAAKRRAYQETGKPDKVRHTTFPAYRETSWWYFEQGKVYRFRDGEMHGVDEFEPLVRESRDNPS